MIADDEVAMQRRMSELTVLAPDARRAARLRERCRAQMRPAAAPTRAVGPALFTGLCVLYLAALVLDVLRLRGML